MSFFTKAFFLKFIKFGIVGFSGLIIDFLVTYICKEKIKIHKLLSNAIGFCVAATNNYILNRIWTFESSNDKIGLEFVEFFGVSVVGLSINTLVLWLLTDKLRWNFYFSKLCAIATATIWNFLANYYFTFAAN